MRSVLYGNIEGTDLKNNSQITSHIDPKVGTGGKLRVLAYNEWRLRLAKTCPLPLGTKHLIIVIVMLVVNIE